jgi:hypothetical protein
MKFIIILLIISLLSISCNDYFHNFDSTLPEKDKMDIEREENIDCIISMSDESSIYDIYQQFYEVTLNEEEKKALMENIRYIKEFNSANENNNNKPKMKLGVTPNAHLTVDAYIKKFNNKNADN